MRIRLAVAALCLVLPACAESVHPLGDLESAQQDERVYGVWVHQDQESGEVGYLHLGDETGTPLNRFRAEPEPGLMRLVYVTHNERDGKLGDPVVLQFFITRIGEFDYANCVLHTEDAPQPNPAEPQVYWFYKCRLRGDELDVWGMDFEATGRIIEAGDLAGVTERDDDGSLKRARITAPTEQMVAYLEGGGHEILFPEENRGTFRRLRAPEADGE